MLFFEGLSIPIPNCKLYSAPACTTCADGYDKGPDGKCYKCPVDHCLTYTAGNASDCLTCEVGYKVDASKLCVACPPGCN